MQQTISVRDLSDFAGACTEFSGDDIAFRDLLAHRIVPLRCVRAGIRCLLTRQDVISCISIVGSEIVGHACGMTCEKAGGVELLRAGEGMIGIYACALLRSPDHQLLVTSRQRHDARMWESLLTFATPSQSCDCDEAVAVVRLIAPQSPLRALARGQGGYVFAPAVDTRRTARSEKIVARTEQ